MLMNEENFIELSSVSIMHYLLVLTQGYFELNTRDFKLKV